MQHPTPDLGPTDGVIFPLEAFRREALIPSSASYDLRYSESVTDPNRFGARQARDLLAWRRPFEKLLRWVKPHAQWFLGGRLNVAENCLDRHLPLARANKTAIIFEGEPGDVLTGTYIWVIGRVDDVLNVFGHPIGTAEIEGALMSHPAVAEFAAVGRPGAVKGQAVVCFVVLKSEREPSHGLQDELRRHVALEIGAIARPDEGRFVPTIPKTRSGKIVRRILQQIAAGGELNGDTSTVEDLSVIAALQGAPAQP